MIRVPSIDTEQGQSLSLVAQQANDALKKETSGTSRRSAPKSSARPWAPN
jgi:hypothetical protein